MKTIALKERTFNLIRELKEKEKVASFDKLIISLIVKKENIPDSMFGSLKGKTKPFTRKEREKLWKDSERDF